MQINDDLIVVCDRCRVANREAMLADPNHPAWKYYEMVVNALVRAGYKFRRRDH